LKKWLLKVGCFLTACALFGLTACTDMFGGLGDLGNDGDSTQNGGGTTPDDDTNPDDGTQNGGGTTPDDGTHQCIFNKKVALEMYQKSAATCTQSAVYYYSCACGEKGTKTFVDGEPTGKHTGGTATATQKAKCDVCGQEYGEYAPLPVIPSAPDEVEIVLPQQWDFTPPAVTTQYGYKYFSTLADGDKFCRFYIDVYNACLALEEGEDVTPTTQKVQDGHGGTQDVDLYIVDSVEYAKYELTSQEALAVWKTVRMEYPEFFWLDNTVTYSSTAMNLQIFKEYALGSTRATLQDEIEDMANDFYTYLTADMSATEFVLTAYDYIVTRAHYAYKADGKTPETAVWAHNLVGVANKNSGVCEAYAKTFDYLCRLMGVDAVTVSGKASLKEGETPVGHAWNIVNIDGVWYNVDATWADQTILYRNFFGRANTDFIKTHEADDSSVYGSSWQFPLPTASEKELSPVRMSENAGKGKMYACVDYAFAEMTNEEAVYTLTLHPHTTVTQAKHKEIYLSPVSFERTDLPKVSQITIMGGRAPGSLNPVQLKALNGLTLNSNINLQDVAWTYPSLSLNGYEIHKSTFSSYRTEEETTV